MVSWSTNHSRNLVLSRKKLHTQFDQNNDFRTQLGNTDKIICLFSISYKNCLCGYFSYYCHDYKDYAIWIFMGEVLFINIVKIKLLWLIHSDVKVRLGILIVKWRPIHFTFRNHFINYRFMCFFIFLRNLVYVVIGRTHNRSNS